MALNFPDSPVDGQIFQAPAFTYQYNAAKTVWQKPSGTPERTALRMNKIINPGMQISQENGSTSGSTNAYYAADQWRLSHVNMATNVQQIAAPMTEPLWYPYYLTLSPTAVFTPATLDYLTLRQSIDGTRISNMQFGYATAKSLVIRFVASTNTPGTYAVSLRNNSTNRSYIIPITVDTTIKLFTFSVPPCTTGIWDIFSPGLIVDFCLGAGTSFKTATTRAWVTGNYYGFNTMNNLAATASSTFSVSAVGVYVDPYNTGIAPEYELPLYEDDLMECQRFWYPGYGHRGVITGTAVGARMGTNHPTHMRTTPTIALVGAALRLYDGTATPNVTSIATSTHLSAEISQVQATTAGTVTAGRPGLLLVDGFNTSYIAHSARN